MLLDLLVGSPNFLKEALRAKDRLTSLEPRLLVVKPTLPCWLLRNGPAVLRIGAAFGPFKAFTQIAYVDLEVSSHFPLVQTLGRHSPLVPRSTVSHISATVRPGMKR